MSYVKDELDEEADKFRKKVIDEKENEVLLKIELESEIDNKHSTTQAEFDEIDERIKEAENINKEHSGLIPDLANEVKRLKKRKELLENDTS